MFRGALWRHRDFAALWSGQTISVVGTAVTMLALPSAAILQLHAGAFEVGALAALQRLPFIFLSLFAGVWIDRVARRPLMIGCNLARAALLGSVPVAAVAGLLTLYQLYAVAFLAGCFTVFFDIAYLAYLPSLVTRQQLMEANTKLQASYSAGDLVGPGIAGVLVQLFGAAQAIVADALSYLIAALTLLAIRKSESRSPDADADERTMWAQIVEGVRWVFAEPILRSQLIGLTAGGFGFFMAIPAIYVYAYRNLHLSPGLLGVVFVVNGAAGLIGLAISRLVVARIGLGRTMWLSQLGMGAGFVALPLASLGPVLPVLAVCFVVVGLSEMLQDVNQVTLRQSLTPAALQGRMNATFRLFFWGSWPVASLAGGAVAASLGPVVAILSGGGLALAAAAIIAFSPVGRLATHPEFESPAPRSGTSAPGADELRG